MANGQMNAWEQFMASAGVNTPASRKKSAGKKKKIASAAQEQQLQNFGEQLRQAVSSPQAMAAMSAMMPFAGLGGMAGPTAATAAAAQEPSTAQLLSARATPPAAPVQPLQPVQPAGPSPAAFDPFDPNNLAAMNEIGNFTPVNTVAAPQTTTPPTDALSDLLGWGVPGGMGNDPFAVSAGAGTAPTAAATSGALGWGVPGGMGTDGQPAGQQQDALDEMIQLPDSLRAFWRLQGRSPNMAPTLQDQASQMVGNIGGGLVNQMLTAPQNMVNQLNAALGQQSMMNQAASLRNKGLAQQDLMSQRQLEQAMINAQSQIEVERLKAQLQGQQLQQQFGLDRARLGSQNRQFDANLALQQQQQAYQQQQLAQQNQQRSQLMGMFSGLLGGGTPAGGTDGGAAATPAPLQAMQPLGGTGNYTAMPVSPTQIRGMYGQMMPGQQRTGTAADIQRMNNASAYQSAMRDMVPRSSNLGANLQGARGQYQLGQNQMQQNLFNQGRNYRTRLANLAGRAMG